MKKVKSLYLSLKRFNHADRFKIHLSSVLLIKIYSKLKQEVDEINAGMHDEELQDMVAQIQA